MRFATCWLPVILWTAVILSASNESFSASTSSRWMERLVGRPIPHAVNVTVRKLAHVIEYAILAALVWRADRRAGLILGWTLAVAIVDETRQAFSASRSGSAWDVLLDFSAALACMLALQNTTRRSGRVRPENDA